MSPSSFLPPIVEFAGPAKAGLAIASTNANILMDLMQSPSLELQDLTEEGNCPVFES